MKVWMLLSEMSFADAKLSSRIHRCEGSPSGYWPITGNFKIHSKNCLGAAGQSCRRTGRRSEESLVSLRREVRGRLGLRRDEDWKPPQSQPGAAETSPLASDRCVRSDGYEPGRWCNLVQSMGYWSGRLRTRASLMFEIEPLRPARDGAAYAGV